MDTFPLNHPLLVNEELDENLMAEINDTYTELTAKQMEAKLRETIK